MSNYHLPCDAVRLQFAWYSASFCHDNSDGGGDSQSDVKRAERKEGAESAKNNYYYYNINLYLITIMSQREDGERKEGRRSVE